MILIKAFESTIYNFRIGRVKVLRYSPIYLALICQLTSTALFQSALAQVEKFSTSETFEESSSEEYLENSNKRILETGNGGMAQESTLIHIDFEVHGKVQGVFFRKYTQAEGNKLGLRGFCRNTSAGTVSGEMEGVRKAVESMKHWLQNTGSPMSKISSVDFKNEKTIDAYTLPPGFEIKRTV